MAYLARFFSSMKTPALILLSSGALLATGCATEHDQQVACQKASDCGNPYDLAKPECCAGFCVVISSGCDSGYRYITSEPEFGECVVDPMCPPPPADMSVVDQAAPTPDLLQSGDM